MCLYINKCLYYGLLMKFTENNEEYLDLKEVVKMTGLSQAYLYIKMKYEDFPKPEKKQVKLTFLRKRALWKRSEIEDYIAKQKKGQ